MDSEYIDMLLYVDLKIYIPQTPVLDLGDGQGLRYSCHVHFCGGAGLGYVLSCDGLH